jgi:pimeloyl-ACP methyl ester carboxylesterase
MDTYADDLPKLTDALDLKDTVRVGHSTGGGEARYIGRHGTKRVAKTVLIGAIPPLMLKTSANYGGLPMEAFDQIRARPCRSVAVLEGSQHVVLRLQQAECEDLGRRARIFLAPEHDGRLSCLLLLHQGVFRDGSHEGSREV